jgi:3'-phosphoadenosine 5'-phosphosulfate sulfotransferase (PAPS reductase)/FAD synthetase
MNTLTCSRRSLTHLETLESESIHIMREVAAECRNPALLFSGGKDSLVLLRLAEKAFRPARRFNYLFSPWAALAALRLH